MLKTEYPFDVPLMTFPTPICVLKSPRPTDESNLGETYASQILWYLFIEIGGNDEYELVAPVVILSVGIVEIACVLDCDLVTLLWVVFAVALAKDLARDTHDVDSQAVFLRWREKDAKLKRSGWLVDWLID